MRREDKYGIYRFFDKKDSSKAIKVLVQDGYFWKNESIGIYEEVDSLNKEEADKCKEFMETIIEKRLEDDLLPLDIYDNIGRES